MSGRLKFRNVINGKNSESPPFVPFMYGLIARTGNVPLSKMAWDPSYYTNALEGICQLLGLEVIVGNFDATLESEAFGARIEWHDDFDTPIVQKGNVLSKLLSEDFMSLGRIPVVIEVTKRLTLSVGRDTAIAPALLGPCSFCHNLGHLLEDGINRNPSERIKHFGSFFTKLVRGLCEQKIDALFFREELLAERFMDELVENKDSYRALYGTMFNIVRAFNAMPIVVTENLPLEAVHEVKSLLKPSGIILLGSVLDDTELIAINDLSKKLRISFGVPLPIGKGTPGELWRHLTMLESFVSEYKPKSLFYSSDGEIPHDTDLEVLHTLMARVNA
jgi:Uroporphyrinogen decarboxylase (URO-D)